MFHVKHSQTGLRSYYSSFLLAQMLSPQEIKQFKEICSSFGIDLTKQMIDKFEAYASLLLEWNKRIHLISKKDATPERIIRHFVDSLSIFSAIGGQTTARLPGRAPVWVGVSPRFNTSPGRAGGQNHPSPGHVEVNASWR